MDPVSNWTEWAKAQGNEGPITLDEARLRAAAIDTCEGGEIECQLRKEALAYGCRALGRKFRAVVEAWIRSLAGLSTG